MAVQLLASQGYADRFDSRMEIFCRASHQRHVDFARAEGASERNLETGQQNVVKSFKSAVNCVHFKILPIVQAHEWLLFFMSSTKTGPP